MYNPTDKQSHFDRLSEPIQELFWFVLRYEMQNGYPPERKGVMKTLAITPSQYHWACMQLSAIGLMHKVSNHYRLRK